MAQTKSPPSSPLQFGVADPALVTAGETEAQYLAFTNSILDDVLPVGEKEAAIAQTMVDFMWRQRRAAVDEARVYETLASDPTALLKSLDRLSIQEQKISKQHFKARAALHAMQDERLGRAKKPSR